MEEEKRRWPEGAPRTPEGDREAGLLLQKAESLRLQGRHEEAIEACRQGVGMIPHSLPGRLLLGRCYLEKGMVPEAKLELEQVARQVEECLPVYKLLSQVYLEEKDVDKALEMLRKTLYFPSAEKGASKQVTPLEMDLLHRDSRPPFATPPPFRPPSPEQAVPAEKEAGEEEETGAAPIPTDTLAEIYIKQGHLERALLVYQEILGREPQNGPAREKFEALKRRMEEEKRAEARRKVQARLEKLAAAVASRIPPS